MKRPHEPPPAFRSQPRCAYSDRRTCTAQKKCERNVTQLSRRNISNISSVACAALASIGLAQAACGSSIQYFCTKAAGVPLKVIKVDLNDSAVKITGQFTKF